MSGRPAPGGPGAEEVTAVDVLFAVLAAVAVLRWLTARPVRPRRRATGWRVMQAVGMAVAISGRDR